MDLGQIDPLVADDGHGDVHGHVEGESLENPFEILLGHAAAGDGKVLRSGVVFVSGLRLTVGVLGQVGDESILELVGVLAAEPACFEIEAANERAAPSSGIVSFVVAASVAWTSVGRRGDVRRKIVALVSFVGLGKSGTGAKAAASVGRAGRASAAASSSSCGGSVNLVLRGLVKPGIESGTRELGSELLPFVVGRGIFIVVVEVA